MILQVILAYLASFSSSLLRAILSTFIAILAPFLVIRSLIASICCFESILLIPCTIASDSNLLGLLLNSLEYVFDGCILLFPLEKSSSSPAPGLPSSLNKSSLLSNFRLYPILSPNSFLKLSSRSSSSSPSPSSLSLYSVWNWSFLFPFTLCDPCGSNGTFRCSISGFENVSFMTSFFTISSSLNRKLAISFLP